MSISQPSQQEIQDYIKTFEGKMSAFLQDVKPLSEEELQKLGIKVRKVLIFLVNYTIVCNNNNRFL